MKNRPATSAAEVPRKDEGADKTVQPEKEAGTVSIQAFQEFQEGVAGTLSKITTTLEAIASRPAPQAAAAPQLPPTIEDISDEDLEQAIVSGEGGAKAIRKAINAAAAKLVNDRIAPLENFGIQTFNELTDRVVGKDLKHYNLLKKEVDAQLAQMDPALRSSPRAREFAYKLALAENFDKVMESEVEAKLRQDAEKDDDGPATRDRGASGRRTPEGGGNSEVEVFGRDSMTALRSVGRDLDKMARKMGYKGGAEEYLKLAEKTYGLDEEEE